MKKQRKIKLTTIMDVKEFVTVAGECDFDVNIFYNHIIVDAKSVLGVFSLFLSKSLSDVYYGEECAFEVLLNQKDAEKAVAVA